MPEQDTTAASISPNDPLIAATTRGFTRIEDVVVAKIAGLAAREVSGVHSLGGATRSVGALRDTLTGTGAAGQLQRGVSVEVGENQTAVDVDIVAEYGVAIHELAEAIRRNIIIAVERMTGLGVTEVNVTVHDVHLDLGPEDDTERAVVETAPRVQ